MLLGAFVVFRKLLYKLQKKSPVNGLTFAEGVVVSLVATFILQKTTMAKEILNQTLSISISEFLLIIVLVAVFSSALTYIRLRKRIKELKLSVNTDMLTKCYNGNVLQTLLPKEIENFKYHKKPLSIIFMDIDGFKRINDTYGHDNADLVLTEFAKIVQLNVRGSSDVFIRCYKKGDEFLIIAPNTDCINAKAFAERLRKLIQENPFQVNSNYESLTMSIGVTELKNENETISDLLNRVNKALLEAKKKKNITFYISKEMIADYIDK